MDASTLNVIKTKTQRQQRLNIDRTEEDRLRRIRVLSQAFVLRKFSDPNITLAKKYELAEKIFLANIKTDKENGIAVADTKIIIIRDDKKPVIIEQKQEAIGGRVLTL